MTLFPNVSLDSVDEKEVFSLEELSLIDLGKIPHHLAIIMDGNRRWAKKRRLPHMMGHWEGAEVLNDVLRAAIQLGVKVLTVYAFSTENWIRPEGEIEALMNIYELYLIRKRETMVKEGIRLDAIGDIARLPKRVQEALLETKRATEHCDKIDLVLALNYGGRDEIRRAVSRMLEAGQKGMLDLRDITEETITRYLDTARWKDPDLLIRTSGELRLSNFLLWQISYAEIYVTDVLWPDFSPQELLAAIRTYQGRDRRLGGSCSMI